MNYLTRCETLCVITVLFISGITSENVSTIIPDSTTEEAGITESNSNETYDLTHGSLTNVYERENMTEVDKGAAERIDEGVAEPKFQNVTALPQIAQADGEDEATSSMSAAETATIFASAFLLMAAVGYAGMVTWRRRLLLKYGSRAELITDDVYDISDLRNFEI